MRRGGVVKGNDVDKGMESRERVEGISGGGNERAGGKDDVALGAVVGASSFDEAWG